MPRNRWTRALEQFGRASRGWPTRVVRVGPGPELVSSTGWHPLESAVAKEIGMRVTTISVNLQGGPTVSIRTPRTLGVDRREDGAVRGLEIDAARGEFVRIVFRAAARPEELDAIAPAEIEPREQIAIANRRQPRSRERAEERHVSG